ncbi:MAG: nitroreductase family protein [Ruminococcaceae bacterium]|nr:nitroreductase family protein [Oscillospiraceae bacterium]
MTAFENLYSRRSIRTYNGEALTDTELKEILKAAYAAPVGRKKYETLTLTVIKNKDFIERWDKITAVSFGDPELHPLYNAPTVILISSVVNEAPQDNVNYSNAAIIAHNMTLAATALGIGSCLIWGAVRTLNVEPELLHELNIPDGMRPCCAITLGHTDEIFEVRDVEENRIKTEYFN